MTKEEIEEGNKLIAEFMGWKYIASDETKHFKYDYYIKPDGNHFDAWKLEYHSSWDWLMPVVEKIRMDYHLDMRETYIRKNELNYWCIITLIHRSKFPMWEGWEAKENEQIFVDGLIQIQVVFKAIIQFIKWHNTHTQTTHK